MKNVLTFLIVIISISGFSQSNSVTQNHQENTKIEYNSLDFIITVNSLKELESELNIKELEDIFEDSKEFKNVSFKLVCKAIEYTEDNKKSVSFKIESNTEDKTFLLSRIQKLKDLGVNYYTNNN